VTPVSEKEPPAEGRFAGTLAVQDGRLASMRYIPTLDEDNTRQGFIDHGAFVALRENLCRRFRPRTGPARVKKSVASTRGAVAICAGGRLKRGREERAGVTGLDDMDQPFSCRIPSSTVPSLAIKLAEVTIPA